MKKLLLFSMIFIISAAVCTAQQGFFAGAQMGYTMGGDVEESDLSFGAQAGMDLNDSLSLEAAWNKFSDEDTAEGIKAEMDVNIIALTIRGSLPLSDTLKLYGGGGINYMIVDASLSGYGESIDVDLDNTIGYHVCAGAAANVADNIQLFGEYRYSFGKIKGEGIDEDYNYGILRAGINLLM